jgi:NitT/TauT family transport system permease protein
VSIAYVISLLLALILSLITTSNKKVEEFMLPILDVLQSFPSFALFPLLLIWFGRTAIVTIIILVITMIWPILFTVISAQKQIRSDLYEAAKMFGADGTKYLRYVLLPLLFPSIITGSIVAWGEAWEAIIAAEIIINISGVGTYLAQSGENFDSRILAVGVMILLGLLFLINKFLWLPLLNLSTRYQQE